MARNNNKATTVLRAKQLCVVASLFLLVGCTSTGNSESATVKLSGIEASTVVAECLREKGWQASVNSDGAVTMSSVPKAQAAQYEAASNDCWSQIEMPTFDDYTDEQRERIYEQHLAMRSCLIEVGFDMPREPTYQAWVDGSGEWSPFEDTDNDLPFETLSVIDANCGDIYE